LPENFAPIFLDGSALRVLEQMAVTGCGRGIGMAE
jgi:hypothetical protein